MNIWIAASDGKTDVVERFLSQGFQAESKDPNGYTPIHAAASYAHIDLLKKLCSDPYNGNINVKDNDGDTPLHHCEDATTARVILEELGGDATLTNNEGKTALAVCEEDAENAELITYLRTVSGEEQEPLGIDDEQLAQFKNNLRYTLENEEETNDPESIQRRQKLEQILNGGNAEQELESYIRDLVRSQLLGNDDSSKRRKD